MLWWSSCALNIMQRTNFIHSLAHIQIWYRHIHTWTQRNRNTQHTRLSIHTHDTTRHAHTFIYNIQNFVLNILTMTAKDFPTHIYVEFALALLHIHVCILFELFRWWTKCVLCVPYSNRVASWHHIHTPSDHLERYNYYWRKVHQTFSHWKANIQFKSTQLKSQSCSTISHLPSSVSCSFNLNLNRFQIEHIFELTNELLIKVCVLYFFFNELQRRRWIVAHCVSSQMYDLVYIGCNHFRIWMWCFIWSIDA